jgi:excisionase family DNA binding protein
MASDDLLSVQDAARRLGVEPMSVRKHIHAGTLVAVKRGRDWSLDASSVERLARQRHGRGRALSPAMAWAVLLLASGDRAGAAEVAGNARYRGRAVAWLEANGLLAHADRLRARAVSERFDAHPAELGRILARSDVLRTGVSGARAFGLIGGPPAVEIYAPAALRGDLVAEHALAAGPGPVQVRWVDDGLWPHLHPGVDGSAMKAAVLIDLLESDDPRARRVASDALRG